MKTNHLFKICRFIQAAALSASLIFASSAFAAYSSYLVDLNTKKVTDLGSLGGGQATAINDAGQVAGYFRTATGDTHAFITGPNGVGMTDFGTLGGPFSGANGINASGQVVGNAQTSTGDYHAFITGSNGVGMTDLGTLGGPFSGANGINASGQAVGYSNTAAVRDVHAFITGPNGNGMTDLGTLGGHYSGANGINASGQVAGYSFTTDVYHAYHAFITSSNGAGMTDLGTLGGDRSNALGINASGQVVGESFTPPFTPPGGDPYLAYPFIHAFITAPNGAGMTDLGTLGGNFSGASGINDAGRVVGYSDIIGADASHAFITGPNGVGMTDLNSLVSPPVGTVWYKASSINNADQVVVSTIPEPASYTLMLAGLGLLGFMARRGKAGGAEVTSTDDLAILRRYEEEYA